MGEGEKRRELMVGEGEVLSVGEMVVDAELVPRDIRQGHYQQSGGAPAASSNFGSMAARTG